MAFDYTSLKLETVEPLLADFGFDGELRSPVASSGAPYNSQLEEDLAVQSVKAVRTMFKTEVNNGTLVEKGDVLFLVSTQGVTIDPALPDRFWDGSTEYQVIRIDPLQPGPVTMLWKVHTRK